MTDEIEQTLEGSDEKADATAWLIAGPLGSGKTEAAEHLRRMLQMRETSAHLIEFSDWVRSEYERAGGGRVNDNDLGEWAAEMRSKHGMKYFAEGIAVETAHPIPRANHVIVSGVRSPTTTPVFEEHFQRVNTVVLWAMKGPRFDRVDEDWDAFTERNSREMYNWKCTQFYIDEDKYDYMIPNNVDHGRSLAVAVNSIVAKEEDSAYTTAPWHRGIDDT